MSRTQTEGAIAAPELMSRLKGMMRRVVAWFTEY